MSPGRLRIIPARAGFTPTIGPHRRNAADHPRSRGVYSPIPLRPNLMVGSSPLARGLRGLLRPGLTQVRIIPARAGFTLPQRRPAARRRDHPRSRGVYPCRWCTWPCSTGSSPLARGLPSTAATWVKDTGIIPARAGFTRVLRLDRGPAADHPRSRGVYDGQPGVQEVRGGIIPARAGFTLADPWNPNEPVLYQTPVAFTADLGPARRVVVAPPRQE